MSPQSVEGVFNSALDEIGQALQKKGIPLEKLIEQGKEIRGKISEEKYGFAKKSRESSRFQSWEQSA